MLCKDCEKRDTCTELCEEAQAYVEQDHVSQREFTLGNENELSRIQLDGNVSAYTLKEIRGYFEKVLTDREKKVVKCFAEGKNRKETAQEAGVTGDHLRKIIQRLKIRVDRPERGKVERPWVPNYPQCSNCPDKAICKGPCDWVQDYLKRTREDEKSGEIKIFHSVYSHNDELRSFNTFTNEDRPFLSDMENSVLLRLWDGMTRKEIAESLNITDIYLRMLISRLKKKAGQLFSRVEA